jgi:hypothetical protein
VAAIRHLKVVLLPLPSDGKVLLIVAEEVLLFVR